MPGIAGGGGAGTGGGGYEADAYGAGGGGPGPSGGAGLGISRDHFLCAVCMRVARSAVGCDSCGGLVVCADCAATVRATDNKCPQCRHYPFTFRPILSLRAIIESARVPCGTCGRSFPAAKVDAHEDNCLGEKRLVCSVPGCGFSSNVRDECMRHLLERHAERVIQNYAGVTRARTRTPDPHFLYFLTLKLGSL